VARPLIGVVPSPIHELRTQQARPRWWRDALLITPPRQPRPGHAPAPRFPALCRGSP
jgi:hypothetical protein